MKSFLSIRPRISTPVASASSSKPPLTPALAQITRSASASDEKSGHQPALTWIKEGDRILRLQINCKCGEVIEIDCMYADGA
jgi:hypothetical protein